MRRRLAVATVAVMLAVAPACRSDRSARDNNLPSAIKNVPSMVDVMADPGEDRDVKKMVPARDVATGQPPKDVVPPAKAEPPKAMVPKRRHSYEYGEIKGEPLKPDIKKERLMH